MNKRYKRIAINLVVQYIKDTRWENALRDLNVDIDRGFDTYELLDVAMDILGVPQDNTMEVFDYENQVFRDGYTQDDMFCRDVAYELLREECGDDPVLFVDKVLKLVKEEGWLKLEEAGE